MTRKKKISEHEYLHQKVLPLKKAKQEKMPPVFFVLAVDPGSKSAWSLVHITPEGDVKVLDWGRYLDAEGDKNTKNKEALESSLRLCSFAVYEESGLVAALEDMPAAYFKSRQAAGSFHESRGRWRARLRNYGCRPVIDIHVSDWRGELKLREFAKLVPKKIAKSKSMGQVEVKELADWKKAARFYLETRFGLKSDDCSLDEVEAICIGIAAAKRIQRGFYAADGKRFEK